MQPPASMTRSAVAPFRPPILAILPSLTATSALYRGSIVPSMTSPPLIRIS